MRRRCLLTQLGAAACALALPAGIRAQSVVRLGVLTAYPPSDPRVADLARSLFSELRKRGWDEGRNLIVERHYSFGDPLAHSGNASKLVAARVDVIFADGESAAHAAQKATQTIPIVMHATAPVETGLVRSLSRPGGNVTGMAYQVFDYAAKEVALMRAIQPKLERIGVVFVPGYLISQLLFDQVTAAAVRAGVTAVKIPHPQSVGSLNDSLAVAIQERVQAVQFWLNYALRGAGWQLITAWAIKNKILTFGASFARGEAAVAFGPNAEHFTTQFAGQLDRVLRGGNPADIPVQQPTVFDLILNRRIIQAIGLTIPLSVLLQATEVIE